MYKKILKNKALLFLICLSMLVSIIAPAQPRTVYAVNELPYVTTQIFNTTKNFTFGGSWGGFTSEYLTTGGINGSACVKYSLNNTKRYDIPDALNFTTPINIKDMQDKERLQISIDLGNYTIPNGNIKLRVYFNKLFDNFQEITVDNVEGWQTFYIDLPSVKGPLLDEITSIGLSHPITPDGWPSNCDIKTIKISSINLVNIDGTPRVIQNQTVLTPTDHGINAVWACNDGEKIKKNDLQNSNKMLNSVWDGSKAKIFGGKNELIAFQVIVEASAAGIAELNVSLPQLTQRGGSSKIVYAPPAKDPTQYVNRPIQIFTENYLNVTQQTHADYMYPYDSSAPASPKNPLGWTPVMLVPENAKKDKGGLPISVQPSTNQGIWIEVYTDKSLPAGIYDGMITIKGDLQTKEIPLELELFDFTLPDENSLDAMIYYEEYQPFLFHGSTDWSTMPMNASYNRFAHRNRVEFVDGYNENTAQQHIGRFDGSDFTAAMGYAGPGEGKGNKIIPRSFYGEGTDFDTETKAVANSNSWMKWFNNLKTKFPDKKTFLYMIDEPHNQEMYTHINSIAGWIHNNPGIGKQLPIFVTKQVIPEISDATDIWAVPPPYYNDSVANAEKARGKDVIVYNGWRPYSGALLIDTPAVDSRVNPWCCFKNGISTYFYWAACNWCDGHNNVWKNARTFSSGQDYSMGDGVLIYPGQDVIWKDQDRGIEGPISSIQMANLRRGLQDHLYLTMAKKLGLNDVVNAALQRIVPKTFSEVGANESVPFPQNANAFEFQRYNLARAITGQSIIPAKAKLPEMELISNFIQKTMPPQNPTTVPTEEPPLEATNIYDVGPEYKYKNINDVPWKSLQPGSTVNIHYRSTPYREKFVISTSGTAEEPIRVVGIPGPNGEMPIIDGENATSNSEDYFDPVLNDYSLILIAPRPGFSWGYKPKYIEISGLELQNADQKHSYLVDGKSSKNYFSFTGAIYGERVENLTIHNCKIHDSSLGIFVNSKYEEAAVSRNILVDGNTFYSNGVEGNYSMHNTYIEAVGATYQYNHYGKLKNGALGSSLKDRSAGTVVRYNYIEASQRALDLVETEAGAGILDKDPSYDKTFVYGNVIYNGPGLEYSTLMIHYGGDRGIPQNYKKGTLYFYNNTLVNTCDQAGADGRYSTIVFDVTDNQETVDARNNIFYNKSYTVGERPSDFVLMRAAEGGKDGKVNFGVNWISPNWIAHATPWQREWNGTVIGTENFITNVNNDPGFVNTTAKNFKLIGTSDSINKAQSLAAEVLGKYDVTLQYVSPNSYESRTINGNSMDLGAFEYSGLNQPINPSTTTPNNPPVVVEPNPTTGTADSSKLYLYHNETTPNFTRPWGNIIASVDDNDGINSSKYLKYTGLAENPYAPTPAIQYGTPIDISELPANSKLRISMDVGDGTNDNPFKVIFNGNSSLSVSGTLDHTNGYQNFDLDISSIKLQLNGKISSIHFEGTGPNGWYVPSDTLKVDEISIEALNGTESN